MLLGVVAPGGSTDTVVLGALKGEDLFLFGQALKGGGRCSLA